MINRLHTEPEKDLERMLNDCSIDAIIAIDLNNNIVAWNTTAEKIYGKGKREVLGKSLLEIILSISNDEESLQAIKTAQQGIKNFLPASKKYYHRMHAENHFIPLKDGDNIKGVMNLVHDVSHRIKAEEELQQLNEELQKRFRQLEITADELASFTYITSSKIKEPIRQIYTGIEHLIKTEVAKLSNTGKASFRRIQSSINRMDLLLDDMLRLSQVGILDAPQDFINTEEVFKEVLALMKNKIDESNAQITFGEMCVVKAHKDQVAIVITQLLDNAIKFNKNITPKLHVECKEVLIQVNDGEREYYQLSVTDNGIGFDEKDSEKMFRMFEKLGAQEYKSSGIGLALVRKIMEVHNGFIRAQSNNLGSIFCCFFPKERYMTVKENVK